MQYTEREIIRSYNQADNKIKQIQILADLNATKEIIIADILAANGIDTAKYKRKCCTCGKSFIGTVRSRKCDECKDKQKRRKAFDRLVLRWLKENG